MRKGKINFKENLKEYWNLAQDYKRLYYFLFFVIVFIGILRVVPNFLFKIIVDNGTLFSSGELTSQAFVVILISVGIAYLISSLLLILGEWVRSHYMGIVNTGITLNLKKKYFNHVLGLDHKFHNSHKTGSLISRLNRGAGAADSLTAIIIFEMIPLFVSIFVVGGALIYFNLYSAMVVLGVIVLFVIYSYIIIRKQQICRDIYNKHRDRESVTVADTFTNVDSIKYFGKDKMVSSRFDKLATETRINLLKYWGWFKWMTIGQSLIVITGTIFLLYFPLKEFIAGTITLGSLVFIYTTYGSLVSPLYSFVHGIKSLQHSLIDMQDLFNYKSYKNEIEDPRGAETLNIQKGDVEFRNIDFRYGRRKLFEGFNLKIPKNKRYAFVGHSGCGKTTLVKLLYRLYDVDNGEVLIDGKNIKDFKQESVRSEMAIVPQECILFDDTIWNNIKFSNPSASNGEVRKAIKFAQLDSIITEMPDGENTIVGERGVKLSGGEKQRVSIARALLADKKILVLDEATSALDSETEHEIQKDLEKLMEGRTSIIIAHRLSTIMHADKIIVMRKGRIVQAGTHRQLINQQGEYKKLWNLQKGGYIE